VGCLLEAFRLQSHFCGETGSPLTRSLLACGQDNMWRAGSSHSWPTHVQAHRIPLRFPFALPERYLPHMTQWEKGQRSEATLADVDPNIRTLTLPAWPIRPP